MVQPPLEEAQEENAAATAIASTRITIVFLIFCGIYKLTNKIAWLKKRNWDQVIQRKGCGSERAYQRYDGRRPDMRYGEAVRKDWEKVAGVVANWIQSKYKKSDLASPPGRNRIFFANKLILNTFIAK